MRASGRGGIIVRVGVPWGRARRLGYTLAGPRPGAAVRLDDSLGLILREPVVARTAMPPWDEATAEGWVVSGPGPWTIDPPGPRLPDGAAWPVTAGAALPDGADAVVALDVGMTRVGADATWLYIREPGATEPGPRPGQITPGTAIRSRGRSAGRGEILAVAGAAVTAQIISVAAWAGYDELLVIRPPDVAALSIGVTRLQRGGPRDGRLRDQVTPAIADLVASAGGRSLPSHQVDPASVRPVVEDIVADLILLIGADGTPSHTAALDAVVACNGSIVARDIDVTPGSDCWLAELADGRLVGYLSGEPVDAFASFSTLDRPLLESMAGRSEGNSEFALIDVGVAGHGIASTLVPALRSRGEIADTVIVQPDGTRGLAGANAFAVIPPDGADAGTLVEVVDLS